MKQNRFYFSVAVLGLAITTLTVSALASASSETKERFFDRERHLEMAEVFEQGDFESWKAMTSERCLKEDLITEENFDKFVEMKNYLLEGNYEEAQKIREELGLPERGNEFKRGFKMGFPKFENRINKNQPTE